MFLHSHLILAIEDPVKWKYNTQLYREKQKLECEHIWNIVLNTWLSPCLRLWPLSSVRETDFCYVMRWFLSALNYREDESEKRNPGYICHSKANLIYMSVLSLSKPWNRVKNSWIFSEYQTKSYLFSNNFLNNPSEMKKKKFCFFKKKAILLRWRSQVCERFQIFSYFQVNRSDVFTKSNRLLMQSCKVYNKTVKI